MKKAKPELAPEGDTIPVANFVDITVRISEGVLHGIQQIMQVSDPAEAIKSAALKGIKFVAVAEEAALKSIVVAQQEKSDREKVEQLREGNKATMADIDVMFRKLRNSPIKDAKDITTELIDDFKTFIMQGDFTNGKGEVITKHSLPITYRAWKNIRDKELREAKEAALGIAANEQEREQQNLSNLREYDED